MRDINRPAKPLVLHENAEEWTQDLLNAIKEYNNNNTPIPKSLYKKYSHDEIRETLERMYTNEDGQCLCCYCESVIDTVSDPNIEHIKPKAKDKFPELTFDWDNLHIACTKCNRHKSDDYDEQNPIVDPVIDSPVSAHLGYKVCEVKGIYRETITHRGITTVEHADLDRQELRRARREVYIKAMETINVILNLGDDPRAYTAKKMLENKSTGPCGSLIKYLLETKF
jgi:uncharacterized protein (TIGR02646 family)